MALLQRLHEGDEHARADLMARCVPRLRHWARGRLPDSMRGPADTDDLIQTTVVKTLDRLDRLEPGETGSLLAYMRQVLLNSIRDEIRRHNRRPEHVGLGDSTGELREVPVPTGDPAVVAAYEGALENLSPALRDAVILRVEFGMTFPEIAAELELASADAARMRVTRALAELAERMPR